MQNKKAYLPNCMGCSLKTFQNMNSKYEPCAKKVLKCKDLYLKNYLFVGLVVYSFAYCSVL